MSTTLTLSYWIYALLLACLAVCWADVLVRPGMLLCGLQAWARKSYKAFWLWLNNSFSSLLTDRSMYSDAAASHLAEAEAKYHQGNELDARWWWAPLWGCFKCVAGQWAFWGYLLLFPLSAYHMLAHLGFAAATILLSIIVQKWSQ